MQLVNPTISFVKGTKSVKYNYYKDYVLDGSFPYDGGLNVSAPYATINAGAKASLTGALDAPAQDLTGSTCTSVTRSDAFQDYFMYQPNGTNARPSPVPVALASMKWNWGGTATTTTGGKTWTGSAFTSPPPSVTSTTSTQMPWYLANVDNLIKVIPADPCSYL